MIQKAWQWAGAHGRKRKNEIHGEEEIQIVVDDTFDLMDTEIEEKERSGSLICQDDEGTLLDSEIPDIRGGALAVLPDPSDGKNKTPAGVGNTSSVMSFKLTFPTVTATTTPLQVLPQFVEVLGKKVDKVQAELDRCHV
ncbi:unnamed protein product, partial [Durusdinium trenchii]